MSHLNVADGRLTDAGFERVLTALLTKKPLLGARQPAVLRTAVTPRTAPPPPDYNAAIRKAHGVPQPTVKVPPAGRGIPVPTNADYNAAVRAAAQRQRPTSSAPVSTSPAPRHASTNGAPPPPDYNAAILRAQRS